MNYIASNGGAHTMAGTPLINGYGLTAIACANVSVDCSARHHLPVQIFLSHASADSDLVAQVKAAVGSLAAVYCTEDDVQAGVNVRSKIQAQIRKSDLMIVRCKVNSRCPRPMQEREKPSDLYAQSVLHQPTAVDAEIPPYAISLAERARAGALAIYAGAGISFSEPTGLPSGYELAKRVHARLVGPFPSLEGVDDTNLVKIADVVEGLPGGEDALRQATARLAEFTSADPSYGHRVLALLLLEGAIDVLTTNWDDCIERGVPQERVHAVINEHDLASIVGPSVLKIHGCASQPTSLLISTEDLDHPPAWVDEQTRARLGTAVVVFVGIGDVAGYVKDRLAEVVAEVSTLDNVRVVSPSIISKWAASQWKEVAPTLADEHKLPATSDAFLGHLAAAYVYLAFADMRQAIAAEAAHVTAMEAATNAMGRHDPATVLSWIRRSAVVAKAGESVLRGEFAAAALLALGHLAGEQITISSNGVLETGVGPIETLISVGFQGASRLRREARNRLERRLAAGEQPPRFLTSGGVGWSNGTITLPDDIYPSGDAQDILDGPASATAEIVRAEEVVNQ